MSTNIDKGINTTSQLNINTTHKLDREKRTARRDLAIHFSQVWVWIYPDVTRSLWFHTSSERRTSIPTAWFPFTVSALEVLTWL